jgi:hypothetical protein
MSVRFINEGDNKKNDTLTDQEVGSLILKLQKNNMICKNSLDSLHQFYDDAEKTIGK